MPCKYVYCCFWQDDDDDGLELMKIFKTQANAKAWVQEMKDHLEEAYFEKWSVSD